MAGKTKVRQFLKSRGSNQTEAAAVIGISPQALSMKANGKTDFRVGEVKALAKGYEMSQDEIMGVFFERED